MELNELIFLGTCAQLPKVEAMKFGGKDPHVDGVIYDAAKHHDEGIENKLAFERAMAVWTLVVGENV